MENGVQYPIEYVILFNESWDRSIKLFQVA